MPFPFRLLCDLLERLEENARRVSSSEAEARKLYPNFFDDQSADVCSALTTEAVEVAGAVDRLAGEVRSSAVGKEAGATECNRMNTSYIWDNMKN
jgi:NTP pyrophosphatase (non-canonical NTP hydrolase)